MGVYLVVLATHDLRYRGSYLSKDKEWRDSWGCDVIGILATVSNEASVLTLTMITLDRYRLTSFIYMPSSQTPSATRLSVLTLTMITLDRYSVTSFIYMPSSQTPSATRLPC